VQFVNMEKPDNLIIREVNETFFSQNKALSSYCFTIIFSTGGGSTSTGVLSWPEKTVSQAPTKQIRALIRAYYEATQTDAGRLFNKVNFEVFSNGTFTGTYTWDDDEVKNEKVAWANVFPQWLNDRLLSILFEAKYGNERDWQNGVFNFTVRSSNIQFEGVIYSQDKSEKVQITMPEYLTEAILDHYHTTNEGDLNGDWQPWNQLEIRSPHNSINLDTDVSYRLLEVKY
jgi:hypothetical protein